MDSILCDELVIEIFHKLPSSPTIPLVSKRWLRLYRHSRTTLSLHLPSPPGKTNISSLISLLSQHPFITSLSLSSTSSDNTTISTFDFLLPTLSSTCPTLTRLHLSPTPTTTPKALHSLSSLPHLTSLSVPLTRPLPSWLPSLPSLKHLSLTATCQSTPITSQYENCHLAVAVSSVQLPLESLTITGLSSGDVGLGWLWRSAIKLQTLKLRNCEGVGDGGSLTAFSMRLITLHSVELRTCRTISDIVLLRLAERESSAATTLSKLSSLLVYDGGSKDGLLIFINNASVLNLRKLDLRLPLDLNNSHLSAMAGKFKMLTSLRLESCCLVTGEGLKEFAASVRGSLEELGLVSCDVVDRVPGLLATLGQSLRRLKKLDLSYNEMVADKELVSMLVNCEELVEVRVRGCKGLTNLALVCMGRVCKELVSVDVVNCGGIDWNGVELFVVRCKKLRRICVEESKVSDCAKIWVVNKSIEVTV